MKVGNRTILQCDFNCLFEIDQTSPIFALFKASALSTHGSITGLQQFSPISSQDLGTMLNIALSVCVITFCINWVKALVMCRFSCALDGMIHTANINGCESENYTEK